MADCRLGRPLNVLIWLVPSTSRVDSQSLVPSCSHLLPWPAARGQPAPTLPWTYGASAEPGQPAPQGNSGKFSSLFNPHSQPLLWWGKKRGWKNIDKEPEGLLSFSGGLWCSQKTHSQAEGTQGRRPPWRSLPWGLLIICRAFCITTHLTCSRLCSDEHTSSRGSWGGLVPVRHPACRHLPAGE